MNITIKITKEEIFILTWKDLKELIELDIQRSYNKDFKFKSASDIIISGVQPDQNFGVINFDDRFKMEIKVTTIENNPHLNKSVGEIK